MSAALVRRIRLPPAATSPAHARHEVTTLVTEAGLEGLLDEARLLTSELVTNGVIHAGTDIELELVADSDGLRVTVTDFAPATAETIVNELRRTTRPQSEGGRGLLLVSRFATRWGMSHERDGRAVWFQIDRRDRTIAYPSRFAGQLTKPAPTIDLVLNTIIGRPHAATGQRAGHYVISGTDSDGRLADLVSRLAQGLNAGTATVSVDKADGRGPHVLVRCTCVEPDATDGRTVRVALPLSRPWTGELSATGARGRHAEPVTALTAHQLALMIENQRLEEAHNEGRGWLLFLAEAGELLAQTMNVELTVALIPRLVVPRLGRWCAVHLSNEYGELTLAASTHVDEWAITGLAEQLDAQMSRLTRARSGAGATPLAPPIDGVVFPLAVRAEFLGTLTVGRPAKRSHDQDELAIIEDLARRAALAIENARIHEHRSAIASTLQQSLLPPALPQIDGLDVAAEYVPAGDGVDVGGDFYDVMALSDGGWLLVVGDVSGKGVAAAAITGLVRDVLHTLAGEEHLEPEHTLHRLNANLVERGGGYYCTLALAFLRPAPPGFTLTLHLAGHDQPVLLRADRAASLIGTGGTALGLLDTIKTPRTTIRLHSGDSVIFYTDGVTERRRGSALYGQQRLCAQLSPLADAPAAVIAAQLRASVLAFSAEPPRDDIAIVTLQVR